MRILALALAIGCGGGASSEPAAEPVVEEQDSWGAAKRTQNRKYVVELETVPAEPEMGELFVMRAKLTDKAGEPIEDATVSLDARMPQHDHGMSTDPVDDPGQCDAEGEACRHPGGIYEASGFKFHMGGEWTVMVEVQGPLGHDNTSFVYDMK